MVGLPADDLRAEYRNRASIAPRSVELGDRTDGGEHSGERDHRPDRPLNHPTMRRLDRAGHSSFERTKPEVDSGETRVKDIEECFEPGVGYQKPEFHPLLETRESKDDPLLKSRESKIDPLLDSGQVVFGGNVGPADGWQVLHHCVGHEGAQLLFEAEIHLVPGAFVDHSTSSTLRAELAGGSCERIVARG